MSKHTEVELKLTCTDPSVWKKIMKGQSISEIAVPESKNCQTLEAHYFDTPTGVLQQAKLAYRIRRESQQWIATIKGRGSSQGGLHERREWNLIVKDAEPNIHIFSELDIGKKIVEVVGEQVLIPILITRFERTSMDVIMPDGSQIEVAADEGMIIVGEENSPILEIELELKNGDSAALVTLGAALAKEYPLLPEGDSKFYRGLKLAGLATDQPPRSSQGLSIDKHINSSEGLRKVLIQLIFQVLAAQQFFLRHSTQKDALYEFSAAVKRLYAVLDFSSSLFTEEQYQRYQVGLQELSQHFKLVEDIDLTKDHWKQCNEILTHGKETNLDDVLFKYRLKEGEVLYKNIYRGCSSPLLLDLWATLIDSEEQKKLEDKQTLEEFARKRLSTWIKVISKEEQIIDWTQHENVYKVALQVEKIKYGIQVFQGILGEMPQFILRLENIQEKLDLLTAYEKTELFLKTVIKGNSPKILYLEVGRMLGWYGREKVLIQSKIDKKWKKIYRLARKWD